MRESSKSTKHYASTEIPAIAAAIDGLLRLESKADAEAFLDNIAARHIIAREQATGKNKTLTLWIRGYEVTPAEANAGAIGNMAELSITSIGGRFALAAEKIALPPAKHPQRKYIRRGKHPNWADPLLRAMKRGKTYATAEEAHADLAQLHDAYPSASIPTKQRLYLMVYSRDENKKGSPITKYILEPKVNEAGTFIMDIRLNTGPEKKAAAPTETKKPAGAAKGYFTAREQLKRKKKPRKNS